ncbi:MAG: RNA-binding S4 domain-containing protein [Proteobacteria bacterium]|nr:RNA-binding S4 domain-containing protein [Pseudomonadota bacterium]
MRLDKWLWAARFFKTRGLAQQAIAGGRVKLNGDRVKPAHAVRAGAAILLRIEEIEWAVTVRGLSERRGPAAEARKLYEESTAGQAARQKAMDQRRWGTEPAAGLKGRPTKRDRRLLEQFSGREPDPVD